jgi:hypothetical protein
MHPLHCAFSCVPFRAHTLKTNITQKRVPMLNTVPLPNTVPAPNTVPKRMPKKCLPALNTIAVQQSLEPSGPLDPIFESVTSPRASDKLGKQASSQR